MGGRSYREWGEYRKERSLLKDFENEKAGAMSNPQEVYEVIHDFPLSWSEDGEYVTEYDNDRLSLHRTQAGAWKALRDMAADRDIELNFNDTSFYDGAEEWYIDTTTLED